MNDITTYALKNGTPVHYISADRFKTVNFTVNITTPLKRPDVTLNALIPAVLKRGCKLYPVTKDLNTYLDDLYGANISYEIKKRGNYQVIVINFNTIADRYSTDIMPFKKLLELACEILFNPLTENNGFSVDYTEREKENLKQYIESFINDKKTYAKLKLIDHMFKDEDYGIFSNGYIEDINDIDNVKLFNQYKDLMKNSLIELFITGPADKKVCDDFINRYFNYDKNNFEYTPTLFGKYKDSVDYISEESEITQGKLSIGIRTNVTVNSPQYFAMMLANNLYGGSVHSKLFLNVREKMSLAYYAGSQYDSYKGFVIVNSGIEFKNYDIAVKEIFNQLDEVKKGNFTDNDIEYSKLAIINTYMSFKDSAVAMENFYSSQTLAGTTLSINEMIEKISKVTKSEIIEAANTLIPDTVFFLKGSNL